MPTPQEFYLPPAFALPPPFYELTVFGHLKRTPTFRQHSTALPQQATILSPQPSVVTP